MHRPVLWIAGSALVLVGMVAWMFHHEQSGASANAMNTEPLVLYCAASNRAVMEEIRADYTRECGRELQIQYGPSQTLLASVEVTRSGDLYLPADDSYLEAAGEKQLVSEVIPIAEMRAGLVFRKDFADTVTNVQDLISSDLRLVQANPETAAVGMVIKRALESDNLWEEVHEKTMAYRATVTEVANDIMVGAADVGFVFDAVLSTYPDLVFVEIPEFATARSQVAVGVLSASKQPQAALHFCRYLTATDRGQKNYVSHGFRVLGQESWADNPELTVFAGSMLRPAIEDAITAFEKREGVTVRRVYNGCGILVAQMKSGQQPDAYFACDQEFMNQVHDLFPNPVSVSQNELVILVQKGNPHGIASLRDLAREGIRVGIGHEKQCAMGWITQNTFRESGVQQDVMPNVTVQSPTGDMLVNQLRTGALDAAVVYLSNAAGAGDILDPIRIVDIECSIATQPWAVSKESKYPVTASRLFERICSVENQEIFAAEGFRWQLDSQVESSE